MSNERKQVLDLLAEGKIDSDDAERLLDKLSDLPRANTPEKAPSGQSSLPRFMCVQVETHEGDAVNVRLPIGLIKSGIKLSAMVPKEAADAMARNGVDFAQLGALGGEDLAMALRDMQIDVASSEGDLVKIFCE